MAQSLSKKISIMALGSCFLFGNLHAYDSQQVRFDGSNEVVAVWQKVDTATSYLQIVGSYGTYNAPTVSLTDPAKVHAFSPILKTSQFSSATVRAVAIWKAYDLATQNLVIQVAVASNSGWTTDSATTISLDGETPNDDYRVIISDDGHVIVATWSSDVGGSNHSRVVTSSDGGMTWNHLSLSDILLGQPVSFVNAQPEQPQSLIGDQTMFVFGYLLNFIKKLGVIFR
ncbi:hypothetical protein [Candidatus Protochlamydia naegleriophila]|nr:hypothetical protein [Candidatus Protochlamydia naegleriophila]